MIADTAFLATASADGQPYIHHRGGPKGFIGALDEGTPAFVDFVGNRQYVSTGNLLENDRVCPEQVVLISVRAWDMNCPQHIPQKVDAAEVAGAIDLLRAQIAELETENRRLKKGS